MSDRTLASVIEAIPDECYEKPAWRGLAWLARDLLVYAAVVAALAAVDSPWLLVPLWAVAGLAISGLFILGHDAAHQSLFASRRLNYLVGQLAMLPSLHIHEAWVFGHNRIHHGHTTRQGMDYVWHPSTPAEYAALSPMRKLLHRIEWSCLGSGVYYGIEIWWRNMICFEPNDKMRAPIRRDRIVVGTWFALFSAALLAWGATAYGTAAGALWMWFKVFAVPFVAWNYVIGFAVYVHHIAPEIRWFKRREWTKYRGQVEGTTVLHMPGWLNFFFHNIFLHVPHHVDMRIPFYGLPPAVDALREHLGEDLIERDYLLRDYLRATRECKLYDFDADRWYTYGDAAVLATPTAQAA
jgi:omega-6 fatty acid desaturase (delta-12 desaturase)